MRRIELTIAIALLGCSQSQAGTIVQTARFHIAIAGTNFSSFNQLDPSLGPLNAVTISVTIAPGSTAGSAVLMNPTSNPITFNASVSGYLSTPAGGVRNSYTVPVTLRSFQSIDFEPIQFPSGAQFNVAYTAPTGPLDYYVGTGEIPPFIFSGVTATADNPVIRMRPPLHDYDINGTETVTYYYGSTFLLPEPASLAMLALGLTTVIGATWYRRRAA